MTQTQDTDTAPLTLDQAVERLLDAARSGLCQTYNDNITDGDPYAPSDTGTPAGNVRLFVDETDTVLADVPTGVDTTADDYQGEDTVRSVILGKSPGLYEHLLTTIDPPPPAAKGVHVYATGIDLFLGDPRVTTTEEGRRQTHTWVVRKDEVHEVGSKPKVTEYQIVLLVNYHRYEGTHPTQGDYRGTLQYRRVTNPDAGFACSYLVGPTVTLGSESAGTRFNRKRFDAFVGTQRAVLIGLDGFSGHGIRSDIEALITSAVQGEVRA